MKYMVTIDNNLREMAFTFDTPQDALNFANIALMHVEKAYGTPNAKYEIIEDENVVRNNVTEVSAVVNEAVVEDVGEKEEG